MNKQLLKTPGADVLSFRKKTQKNLMGGGGGAASPPSLLRPRVKFKLISFASVDPFSWEGNHHTDGQNNYK